MQKYKKTQKKHRISALFSVFVLVLSLTCTVLVSCKNKFSYLESDLSDYVNISESDYKNFTVTLPDLSVTDDDVERKIMGLLAENRNSDAENNAAKMFRVPVTVADDVYIYYRGYTVDENGVETEVENASNFLGKEYKLTVGSLSFIEGFEEGLIGAVPWDHHFDPEHNRLTSGTVSDGDIIYVSYAAFFPDGTSIYKNNERIDLSDANLDARYGRGFRDFFTDGAVEIGKKIETKTFSYGDGDAVYSDIKINYSFRCNNEPLTIDATFPYDYTESDLRGLAVKFDVYFNGSVIYNTPEYNESFITDVLKLDAEKLSEYKGESILEKHKSYLIKEIEAEKELLREFLIEEKMWEHFTDSATVIKLPEKETEEIYTEKYTQIANEYRMYFSSHYDSIEEYAYNAYGYKNLAQDLMAEAEEIIVEKIIFYYIIREENLVPSGDEFDALYEKLVSEHLDYYLEEIYDDELAGLKTDAEREARVKEIKEEMMEYYGEEYFTELVYYEFAYDTVKAFGTVK